MKKALLLLTVTLIGIMSFGQTKIKPKQIEEGSEDGMVMQTQGGVLVNDSFSYNDLKDKPAVTGGTLTTVGLSMPTGFAVSGSPLTGTGGTLNVSTTLNGPIRGNGTGFVVGNLNLASEVTGTLGVAHGGTGLTTVGTNGQVLVSNGTAWVLTTPTWITGNQSITWTGTGDVTGTASGTTSITAALSIAANAVTTVKIANSAVTYAKIQNVAASKLLGNPTGSAAAPSEITLGTGLSFSGSTLNVSASAFGTDTTVARTIVAGDIASGVVTIPLGATPITTGKNIFVFVNGVKAPIAAISTETTNVKITNSSMPYAVAAGDYVEVAYSK